MAFLIHSIANENVVPWEYFPCSDALITGEVLAFKDGKMVSATLADLVLKKPLYLSMCEKDAGEEEIPAVRIRDDMILEGGCIPLEEGEILEGARGYIVDFATLAGDGVELGEIRQLLRASHALNLLSSENAEGESEQHILFEVVGVLLPEMGKIPFSKVLIRLIG